jgi:hypothetical protein
VELCKKRKFSLAEIFSEEILCANLGLKEKHSTHFKLLRWQAMPSLAVQTSPDKWILHD